MADVLPVALNTGLYVGTTSGLLQRIRVVRRIFKQNDDIGNDYDVILEEVVKDLDCDNNDINSAARYTWIWFGCR